MKNIDEIKSKNVKKASKVNEIRSSEKKLHSEFDGMTFALFAYQR